MGKRRLGRREKWALLVSTVIVGAGAYIWWADTRPRITALGPRVEVEFLGHIHGTGGKVSYDGRIVSVRQDPATPLYSVDGGEWQGLDGLEPATNVAITHIASDGTIYGVTLQPTQEGFSIKPDRSVDRAPFDRPEYYVRDSSADGRVLVASFGDSHRYPMVIKDGKADSLTQNADARYFCIAERVSTDGSLVFVSMQSHLVITSQVWRDGVHDPSLDIESTIRLAAISRNGRWRADSTGKTARLFDGGTEETIWRRGEHEGLVGRIGDWLSGLGGAARRPSGANADMISPMFVSDDGRLVIGTARISRSDSRPNVVAWQRGAGWASLQDEIAKRGGVLPSGFLLTRLDGVSADGRTISATAVREGESHPVVIRFRALR